MANVEDGLPDFGRQFDGIFCSNLLEHLVAPHLFLLRLHDLLAEDGRLFIHVPTMPPFPLVDRLIQAGDRPQRLPGQRAYQRLHAPNAGIHRRSGPATSSRMSCSSGRAGGGCSAWASRSSASLASRRWRWPAAIRLPYPEKRVEVFAPRFASGALPRA